MIYSHYSNKLATSQGNIANVTSLKLHYLVGLEKIKRATHVSFIKALYSHSIIIIFNDKKTEA